MTDPLAHLYAETGGGDPDEDLELPVVETSLEELVAYAETLEEELSDHDLDELAILVASKLEAGGLPDEEAAELGLGEIHVFGPSSEELAGERTGGPAAEVSRELVLNDVGRAVLKRLIERRHPDLRFGSSK